MVEKRGRKSAADRDSPADDVVALVPGTGRPPPPADFGPAEAKIWVELVAAVPPRYFTGDRHTSLRNLVRHQVAADLTWSAYHRALLEPGTDPKELLQLAAMYHRESDGVRRASTNLRLTRMSRIARGALRNQVRPFED